MSPSDMEVLIHYYGSPGPHPRIDAPAVRDAITRFVQLEVLVGDDGEGCYSTTGKGEAWLRMALDTPVPVMRWIDPREETR